MRPFLPVPVIALISAPSSRANLRTDGLANAVLLFSPEWTGGGGAGAGAGAGF